MVFGRPFVKRFALCYQTVVLSCLSCLSVCDVHALWPNGWIDQDETWHAGRPRLWPHCIRWGPSYPLPKGHNPHPIFGPCLLRPNGYGGRPQPMAHCVRWGPSPLNFRPMFIIVIVISLKHCTNAQSLLVCSSSSSSFSILCILFLEKSLLVLSLFRYAQLHHTAPIAEVGVAN